MYTYAKLFERRRGVQSAYDGGGGGGGGGGSPLTTGGVGGAVGKSHSLLKTQGTSRKRVHSAPALSCSTASLTFVRTTELSGLLSMAQHVICRSLSSEGGRQKLPGGVICRSLSSGRGGGGKSCQGAAFHTRWGGAAAPPKAMLDPGLQSKCHVCSWGNSMWAEEVNKQ